MAAWAHPDVSLDELVEHAEAFLDILILASGYQSDGSIALWSPRTLQKALGWACYFEQVLEKLPIGEEGEASKLALDSALDALLAAFPLPPGISGLSCSTLANARSRLVQVLVQALPLQNARLVADFVESDENSNVDLWDVVIKTLSKRCLAVGSVKALQQVLDASAGLRKSRTFAAPNIWKTSEGSFGYKAASSVRWAREALKYITAAETIHKLSGATLIFQGSRNEWTLALNSLQRYQDGGRDVRVEIAELCCLFLASSRWKELPRRLLHPECKCLGGQLTEGQLTESYTDWWVGKNLVDIHLSKEVIPPEVRDEVEGYLQSLLDSGTVWWSLAPILLAAVFAESSALELYLQRIGKRINDAPTRLCSSDCSSDCSCQECCRSDAQERAWCLLILLDGRDGHSGSDLREQLHGMLRLSAKGQ